MSSTNKIRADELLVQKGLCESRSLARALILSGKVTLNNEPLGKPGKMILPNTPLSLSSPPAYVSRSGEKLESFLNHFNIDPSGKHILDVGASTGGFTDCLLQKGALSAACVDVGHGQLHPKLLNNPQVTNLEKINARNLTSNQLPRKAYDILVIDLSFISLTKVLPNLWPFLELGGLLIALIKPQFEATKEEIDKVAGILKDLQIHQRIVEEIIQFCLKQLPQSSLIGWIPSPLKGTDGNQEFLIGLNKSNTNSHFKMRIGISLHNKR